MYPLLYRPTNIEIKDDMVNIEVARQGEWLSLEVRAIVPSL